MIRLTLLLLAAITVTMVVAGREPEMTAEADASEPPAEVTRAAAGPAEMRDTRLALGDEAGAIARALAATNAAAEAHEAESVEPQELPLGAGSNTAPEEAEAETATEAAVWYVTGARVNLREGPSTSTAVVGQAREGQRAELLDGTPGGWAHIRLIDSGLTAYIYGRFLSETPTG